MYPLWEKLNQLKKLRWIDLTHPLTDDSPFWSGIPEGSVEIAKTVFDWGNPMLECLIQTFKFPGQFGTHIDFPGHFIRGAALSEKTGIKECVFPLCVIDITKQVQKTPEYAVTVEDIQAYEAQYGAIPDGAFVALYTGWSTHWPDMDALSGLAADGSEHFPGWSLPALQYLYETRHAAANGHETLDTDSSAVAAAAGDLACERYVLKQNKLQIELLCNLDQVPPAGAVLVAAFPNIVGATGLPVRAWAIAE
ncbi:MAG: cyclase family protein [Ndongobacter sp.]|nr:cyclase family protein [Ndongobacter sp.]